MTKIDQSKDEIGKAIEYNTAVMTDSYIQPLYIVNIFLRQKEGGSVMSADFVINITNNITPPLLPICIYFSFKHICLSSSRATKLL